MFKDLSEERNNRKNLTDRILADKELNEARLDPSHNHEPTHLGKRQQRRCVVCCELCPSLNPKHIHKKSKGMKCSTICSFCKVPLCGKKRHGWEKSCHERYHSDAHFPEHPFANPAQHHQQSKSNSGQGPSSRSAAATGQKRGKNSGAKGKKRYRNYSGLGQPRKLNDELSQTGSQDSRY